MPSANGATLHFRNSNNGYPTRPTLINDRSAWEAGICESRERIHIPIGSICQRCSRWRRSSPNIFRLWRHHCGCAIAVLCFLRLLLQEMVPSVSHKGVLRMGEVVTGGSEESRKRFSPPSILRLLQPQCGWNLGSVLTSRRQPVL